MSFSSLESLVGTLEHRPQWQSHQRLRQILDCWPQVVGDVVAVQTRPLSIRRDVLSVSTSTPVWSQNLAFQRHHILHKLSTYVPDHQLTDIRFSTAQWLELRKSSKGNQGVKQSLKRYHLDQSEARSLWSYHPCKLTSSSQSASPNPSDKKSDPKMATPVQTFHDWAAKIQMRSQRLPKCPRCLSPAPIGELQRWSVCSLCVSQDW